MNNFFFGGGAGAGVVTNGFDKLLNKSHQFLTVCSTRLLYKWKISFCTVFILIEAYLVVVNTWTGFSMDGQGWSFRVVIVVIVFWVLRVLVSLLGQGWSRTGRVWKCWLPSMKQTWTRPGHGWIVIVCQYGSVLSFLTFCDTEKLYEDEKNPWINSWRRWHKTGSNTVPKISSSGQKQLTAFDCVLCVFLVSEGLRLHGGKRSQPLWKE